MTPRWESGASIQISQIYHFQESISLGHDGSDGAVPLDLLQRIQHPDDVAKDAEIRERLTTEGGVAEGEMRYRHRDGGWKTLRVHYRSGRRLGSGKYEMYGVSQNVSELASARDIAAIASDRLELAMSAAKAGVWETDMRTGARWTSEPFRALVGEEAMARQEVDHFGLYADEELERVRESWERCLRSGGIEHMDTRLYRPGGPGPWVRIFMRVLRDPSGLPLRAVGLMIDIDEQKRQELALMEAKRLAEAATVAKSNFLASMSHEIRTPLNGVLGMAQALVDDDLTDAQREKVNIILDSGKTLMALLNDVLDISKIEAGRLEISRVDGEIDLTIERMRDLFQAGAQRAWSVDHVRTRSEDLPKRMLYDPVRVRQCVSNLLSNAIKFTERGRVAIRVGADMRPPGEWLVKISVSDTGIGMDRVHAGPVVHHLHAGGRLDHSSLRGHWSRPRHHAPAGATDGRRCDRREPGRRGFDFPPDIPRRRLQRRARPQRRAGFRARPNRALPEAETPKIEESTTRLVHGAKILLVDDNPVNRQVVKLFLASISAGLCRSDQRPGGAGQTIMRALRHRTARRPYAGHGRQGNDQAHPQQYGSLARHSRHRADCRRYERRSRAISRHGHERLCLQADRFARTRPETGVAF